MFWHVFCFGHSHEVRNNYLFFPDFYIKVKESSGEIKKCIIEIKPKKQTVEPIPQKRKTKGYIFEVVSIPSSTSFSVYTGVSTFSHTYASGGTAKINVSRPFDGQVVYLENLYYTVGGITVGSGGTGYTGNAEVTIGSSAESWGVSATAVGEVTNGSVTSINIVNSGSQYINSAVTITIAPPSSGTTATASVSNYQPIYYRVNTATLPSAGISTISFLQTLNNTVSAGTTVYFARASLQLATTIGFEYVGSGTNINTAKPALGGVVITENQVVQLDGGSVTYTSTDQGGNFRIGDGVAINQQTGTISGSFYSKSLFSSMTPYILALGGE
jgi:hypothetical protein